MECSLQLGKSITNYNYLLEVIMHYNPTWNL